MSDRTARNIVLSLVGVFAVVVLFIRAGQHPMPGADYSRVSKSVSYYWAQGDRPWTGTALADPVNIGRYQKKYTWVISIPSYQARNYRYGSYIDRDAIAFVEPVEGAAYSCKNNLLSITCSGSFFYRLHRGRVLFQRGESYITPPESWLSDTRAATLTIYKY